MKWLKYILGGLVALIVLTVAGLWLAGLREAAGKNQFSVQIDRPSAQVWRHIATTELVKQWVGGLVEITPVSGTALTPGAKSRMVVEMDGQRTTLYEEILEVQEGRMLVMRLRDEDNNFTEVATYTLEETAGKTRLTLSASTQYHSLVFRLLEPLISPSAERKLEADLQRLKAQVEAEPAQAPSPAQP